MPLVFLSGPLLWRDLISVVLETIPGSVKEPSLSGYAWANTENGILPILTERPGVMTQGHVVDCDDKGMARLGFFAAIMGMGPAAIDLQGASCTVFVGSAPDAPDWDAETWHKVAGPALASAAHEIMGYFGRMSAGKVLHRRGMILARAWAIQAAKIPAPSDLRGDLTASQVQVASCEATHEGYFLTRHYALRHTLFDGGQSAEVQREVFVATDAAIVLLYDPKRDRVLLVEQFRMGPFGRGDPSPWVLEPVAGRVDAGETPESCAMRECQEEAGLDIQELLHVSSHYCSPGCSTEVFHCYIGLCDLPDLAKNTGGLAAEHEDIRTHVISFARARALVETGEANIGPMVLLLLWLERERDRLRGDLGS